MSKVPQEDRPQGTRLVRGELVERVVGIDPGTKCGYAVLDAKLGHALAYGEWDLSTQRHEGAGMRFVRLHKLFTETVSAFPDCVVAYEEVSFHAGVYAAHIYGGIVSVIQMVCEELELPYRGIPVATVKKHATGKGNAKKDMMIAAAKQQWPFAAGMTDNVADAFWIADTLRKEVAQ